LPKLKATLRPQNGIDLIVPLILVSAVHTLLHSKPPIAALLALADYRRRGHYWDHGEIAAEFTRRLVRQRKIFGSNSASFLDDLKTRRHQADYSTISMSDKIAERALDKSRKLVELIEAALESTGGRR
jgi:hypothetical protein